MKIHWANNESWQKAVPFFGSPGFEQLVAFVDGERSAGKSVLPGKDDVFNALAYTPFESIKVVILGQDPYPNKRHAHGLAFSIPDGETDIPMSLRNILKELKDDVGADRTGGNLSGWARQGVLLLNRALTVEEGKINSHKGKGWELLTRDIIKAISDRRKNVVFILWGKPAQECKKLIDATKHCIIESPHPSPLSARSGFFGSKPFSKANACLVANGMGPIDWSS
jgi:uracil-DNA glycosylase